MYFDLVIGDKNARPDGKMAYKACENASYDTFLQGNYGAGMGATVGKYMGRERSMKSGIGAYAVQLGELKVGAVVTLNALGDIYDIDTDKKIAGALDENGLLLMMRQRILRQRRRFRICLQETPQLVQ